MDSFLSLILFFSFVSIEILFSFFFFCRIEFYKPRCFDFVFLEADSKLDDFDGQTTAEQHDATLEPSIADDTKIIDVSETANRILQSIGFPSHPPKSPSPVSIFVSSFLKYFYTIYLINFDKFWWISTSIAFTYCFRFLFFTTLPYIQSNINH